MSPNANNVNGNTHVNQPSTQQSGQNELKLNVLNLKEHGWDKPLLHYKISADLVPEFVTDNEFKLTTLERKCIVRRYRDVLIGGEEDVLPTTNTTFVTFRHDEDYSRLDFLPIVVFTGLGRPKEDGGNATARFERVITSVDAVTGQTKWHYIRMHELIHHLPSNTDMVKYMPKNVTTEEAAQYQTLCVRLVTTKQSFSMSEVVHWSAGTNPTASWAINTIHKLTEKTFADHTKEVVMGNKYISKEPLTKHGLLHIHGGMQRDLSLGLDEKTIVLSKRDIFSVFMPNAALPEIASDRLGNLSEFDMEDLSTKLRQMFAGYKVEVTGGLKRKEIVTIRNFSITGPKQTHIQDPDTNGLVSIATYYERYGHYTKPLRNLPCAEVGNTRRKFYVPLELCKLQPYQAYRTPNDPELQRLLASLDTLSIADTIQTLDTSSQATSNPAETDGVGGGGDAATDAHRTPVKEESQMKINTRTVWHSPSHFVMKPLSGVGPLHVITVEAGTQPLVNTLWRRFKDELDDMFTQKKIGTVDKNSIFLQLKPDAEDSTSLGCWAGRLLKRTLPLKDTAQKIILVVAIPRKEHSARTYKLIKRISEETTGFQSFCVNMGTMQQNIQQDYVNGVAAYTGQILHKMHACLPPPPLLQPSGSELAIGVHVTRLETPVSPRPMTGPQRRYPVYLIAVHSRDVHSSATGYHTTTALETTASVNMGDLVKPHLQALADRGNEAVPTHITILRSGSFISGSRRVPSGGHASDVLQAHHDSKNHSADVSPELHQDAFGIHHDGILGTHGFQQTALPYHLPLPTTQKAAGSSEGTEHDSAQSIHVKKKSHVATSQAGSDVYSFASSHGDHIGPFQPTSMPSMTGAEKEQSVQSEIGQISMALISFYQEASPALSYTTVSEDVQSQKIDVVQKTLKTSISRSETDQRKPIRILYTDGEHRTACAQSVFSANGIQQAPLVRLTRYRDHDITLPATKLTVDKKSATSKRNMSGISSLQQGRKLSTAGGPSLKLQQAPDHITQMDNVFLDTALGQEVADLFHDDHLRGFASKYPVPTHMAQLAVKRAMLHLMVNEYRWPRNATEPYWLPQLNESLANTLYFL